MIKKLTLVLALLAFSSPALGKDSTIKELLEVYDAASHAKRHIIHRMFSNVQNGMSWYKMYQKNKGVEGKVLYCLPGKLVMTGEQAFQIFRGEVERRKKTNEPNGTSGLFLLLGLMRTFPCK
jgi:hypothetical protein